MLFWFRLLSHFYAGKHGRSCEMSDYERESCWEMKESETSEICLKTIPDFVCSSKHQGWWFLLVSHQFRCLKEWRNSWRWSDFWTSKDPESIELCILIGHTRPIQWRNLYGGVPISISLRCLWLSTRFVIFSNLFDRHKATILGNTNFFELMDNCQDVHSLAVELGTGSNWVVATKEELKTEGMSLFWSLTDDEEYYSLTDPTTRVNQAWFFRTPNEDEEGEIQEMDKILLLVDCSSHRNWPQWKFFPNHTLKDMCQTEKYQVCSSILSVLKYSRFQIHWSILRPGRDTGIRSITNLGQRKQL